MLVHRAPSPSGRIASIDTARRAARARRAAGDDARERAAPAARRSRRGIAAADRPPARRCCRTTRSITTTSRSRWWWPTPSSTRATPRARCTIELRDASRARSTSTQARRDAAPPEDSGDGRRPTRSAATSTAALAAAAVQARRRLHDADREPQPDGAARHHRGWDGDQLTLYDATQDVSGVRAHGRQHLRHPAGQRARDLPLRRRRLRLQGLDLVARRCWRRWRRSRSAGPVKLALERDRRCSARSATARTPSSASRWAPTHDGTLTGDRATTRSSSTSTFDDCDRTLRLVTAHALRVPEPARPRTGSCKLEPGHADLHARARRGDRHLRARIARWTSWRTQLKMDPLALRLQELRRAATRTRTCRGRASRCASATRIGAERFGWARRTPQPRSMRDGAHAGRLGHGDRHLSGQPHGRRRLGHASTPTARRWCAAAPRTSAPAPTR